MDTTKLPSTRKEAQKSGEKFYFTGQPCKYGHVAPRKTKGACVECIKEQWLEAAPKRAQYFADYNKSEAGQEAKKRYYAANKAAVIARAQARPEEHKRTYRANYYERNPDWKKTDTSFRRKRHKVATPKWLTAEEKRQIKALYLKAMEMTRITGVACVVDHIVPLRGKSVSGLNVPWNLEIMTREANLAKSNKQAS